jgi:hypothetical protein
MSRNRVIISTPRVIVRVPGPQGAEGPPAPNTTWDLLPGKPETFPPSAHNHDDRYFTETETGTLIATAKGEAIAAAAEDATTKADTAEENSKTYADGLVAGLVDDRGNFDASVNNFPTSANGGSGIGGAILKGDLWTIEGVATAGPLLGYGNGVIIRAGQDNPGQTVGNWRITSAGYGYIPENTANKSTGVHADQASNTKFPTVKALYDWAVALFETPAGAQAKANARAAANLVGSPVEFSFAFSDMTTAITAGASKAYFPVPVDFTLTEVEAQLSEAQPAGSIFTLDLNIGKAGTSLLGTKLTVDNTEITSATAATAPTIATAAQTKGTQIWVDVDQVGTAGAKGGSIILRGIRA